jgi:phosphatidylserine/phosphatidylglycerophosphate/cardiolipin synthase-like enzyme
VKDRGLWELSTARLGDLRRVLDGSATVSATRLQADGFDGPPVQNLIGMPAEMARRVVDAVLAERTHRPRPQLELVWSGPEIAQAQSRDTSQVLIELFSAAERRVIVAGFAFWGASTIFKRLHDRAVEKNLDVEFFIHIDPSGRNQQMTAANFFQYTWPWKDRLPRIYYDGRSDDASADPSSMHAKCVVIDESLTFITSANFTDAAHHRNVEVGILVRDEPFATRVAGQWRSLSNAGLFRPL